MQARTKAHIAVLLTNFFFAANFGLIKMISPSMMAPIAVNIVRVGLSLVFFWFFWILGDVPARIHRADYGRFFLCALTGIAINQSFFIKGLTLTSTIHASLLILVTPIIVTLFSIWVLKEYFSVYKAAGLVLGVSGAVMLVLQKETSGNAENYLLGDMLIIINAISYSIYFIMVKPLMSRYSPLHVIRWIFTIGFFMLLPFGWNETMAIRWESFEWNHYVALSSVVLTGTFLAYYFNAYGIQHLGAGTTGTYIYTQPVFAVVIATLFVGENLDWKKIIAGALIFSGVYFVNFRRRKG